jgi:hypothetical protein
MTRGVSAAVVDQKKRLEVKESLKEAYRVMKWESLLKRCWNETPSLRPTAQQILQELQQIQALHEIREEQAKQNNLPGPTYGEVFDSEKSENDVKKSITSPENNSLRVPSLPSLHPSSKQVSFIRGACMSLSKHVASHRQRRYHARIGRRAIQHTVMPAGIKRSSAFFSITIQSCLLTLIVDLSA